jgi:hypothetical protein
MGWTMARGKHARRKQNRDSHALDADIAQLTADIAGARSRLASAERSVRERLELEGKLKDVLRDRDNAVADERDRLAEHIEVLSTVLKRSRDVNTRVHAAWLSYVDNFIEDEGRGAESIDSLLTALNDGEQALLDLSDTPSGKKLDLEGKSRLALARGQRRSAITKSSEVPYRDFAPLVPTRIRPQWNEWISSRTEVNAGEDPPEEIADLVARWSRATAQTLTPTVALAAHPHPQVDTLLDTDHPLARLLGVDLSGPDTPSPRIEPPPVDALLSDRAYHALRSPWDTAEKLLPIWRSGRDVIVSTARIPTPLHAPSRHPSPADAVAVRHWYSIAAAGQWARNEGTHAARGYGEAAVGMAAASTFWMPPAQVRGYVDSEPISAEDSARIRLSYPNVFLALGKPITLEPQAGATAVDTERMERMSVQIVHSSRANSSKNWLLSRSIDVNRINLLDLIASVGAIIEGVLLLGDSEGLPSGRFAWCLAVPAPVGVLGRWVLPAHRDRTAYSNQVDALLAVAAWADWHEPPAPGDTTTNHRRSATLQHAAAAGGVHVLNAIWTSSTAARSNPTGRTVTAHIRRGHWRRQHVGVGRAQVRMVRVSPAIVGAGNRPLTTPIYRLPSPPPSTSS